MALNPGDELRHPSAEAGLPQLHKKAREKPQAVLHRHEPCLLPAWHTRCGSAAIPLPPRKPVRESCHKQIPRKCVQQRHEAGHIVLMRPTPSTISETYGTGRSLRAWTRHPARSSTWAHRPCKRSSWRCCRGAD